VRGVRAARRVRRPRGARRVQRACGARWEDPIGHAGVFPSDWEAALRRL